MKKMEQIFLPRSLITLFSEYNPETPTILLALFERQWENIAITINDIIPYSTFLLGLGAKTSKDILSTLFKRVDFWNQNPLEIRNIVVLILEQKNWRGLNLSGALYELRAYPETKCSAGTVLSNQNGYAMEGIVELFWLCKHYSCSISKIS